MDSRRASRAEATETTPTPTNSKFGKRLLETEEKNIVVDFSTDEDTRPATFFKLMHTDKQDIDGPERNHNGEPPMSRYAMGYVCLSDKERVVHARLRPEAADCRRLGSGLRIELQ